MEAVAERKEEEAVGEVKPSAVPSSPWTEQSAKEGRGRLSRNATVLVVAIALFSLITTFQFVAALVAHSNALLVDCASMLVDTISYVGNLMTECTSSRDEPHDQLILARRALASSGLSIVVLYGITAWGLAGALETILARHVKDELEPGVVLVFGLVGLVVDGLTLTAFRLCGFQEDETQEDSSFVNMCSALVHVLADALRSTTSVALGLIVIFDRSVNGSVCDAYATLVVAATIVFGSLPLLKKWLETATQLGELEAALDEAHRPRRSSDDDFVLGPSSGAGLPTISPMVAEQQLAAA